MTRIVVSGALANKHRHGGEAWVRLSWALGLGRLGYDVYFVEQISPDTCVDPEGRPCGFDQSANLSYFRQAMSDFGLGERSSLILGDTHTAWGLGLAELTDVASDASLLVNISGHLSHPELLPLFGRKAYIDVDPGFTQFWLASGRAHPGFAAHDDYFTVGENIGRPGCPIPTGGLRWHALPQPVVMDHWPVSAPSGENFTTVASWRGAFGPVEFEGRRFGVKAHEFRKFMDLPRGSEQGFEIALDIHPEDCADRSALEARGWKLADPFRVARDPCAFRGYVAGSVAEFSVAQGIYVETKSGWFSDRTVRYLASGRPVVVQDTGFSRNYPVGDGLLTFRTLDEARNSVREVLRNYSHHCRAARSLAGKFFDSDRVAGRLLEETGVS